MTKVTIRQARTNLSRRIRKALPKAKKVIIVRGSEDRIRTPHRDQTSGKWRAQGDDF
jgi:hypothetical protein